MDQGLFFIKYHANYIIMVFNLFQRSSFGTKQLKLSFPYIRTQVIARCTQ